MRRGEILLRYFRLGKPFVRESKAPSRITVQHLFNTSTIRQETVRHFQATDKLPLVWHILHNSNIFHCSMHSPPRRGHSTHNCIYFVHLEICPRWRCESSSCYTYTLFDESGTITIHGAISKFWDIVVWPFVCNVCLCVQSGTISKFWTVPLSSKSV